MALTQQVLQSILAKALSLDPRNPVTVVPIQGSIYNPQLNQSGAPSTWCGFWKSSSRNISVPYYNQQNDSTKAPTSIVQKISTVRLQFIGGEAEEAAESIAHWPHRSDVIALFAEANAVMFMDGGDVHVLNLPQPGSNAVLAYNVEFKVQWGSEIQTIQKPLSGAIISGHVTISP